MQFYIFIKSYFLQVLKSLTKLCYFTKKTPCNIFSYSLQVKHCILVDFFIGQLGISQRCLSRKEKYDCLTSCCKNSGILLAEKCMDVLQ